MSSTTCTGRIQLGSYFETRRDTDSRGARRYFLGYRCHECGKVRHLLAPVLIAEDSIPCASVVLTDSAGRVEVKPIV